MTDMKGCGMLGKENLSYGTTVSVCTTAADWIHTFYLMVEHVILVHILRVTSNFFEPHKGEKINGSNA